MFCSACGSEIAEGNAFCTQCGRPVPNASPKPETPKREAPKGGRWRTDLAVVAVALVIWAGAAGIAYGVVELTGGGPQGEQGPPGERGPRGLQGPSGASGSSIDLGTSRGLERIARMYAISSLLDTGDYTSLSTSHPQVEACVDYIMNGTGSGVECGFQRAE